METAHFRSGPLQAIGSCMQGTGKRFVYILRSETDPTHHYVGIASDVDQRLAWHNAGPCGYTTAFRPWRIAVSIEFPTEREARRFERHLKSGSSRAFAARHFAPSGRVGSGNH